MIGIILGNRYELLKEIGSGGMANVYLAHCRLLNRNVAVKILKNEFVNDKEFLERFNKEAQVAATISSPNIVNVYDVGHDGDIHYIVMEYVEGQTLKEYIDANGMLSWQETVEYAIQICSALDKAHKNGIVHRDIKPQNIILTNDGVLKVTDFGIARATSNDTMNVGESTMGSVHYFSPEQARGGYTDAKSDIYSLGIVMYELITGILPFNGDSPIAIAIKHMQTKPVSPKEFNISIPLAVEAIILKAMSKEQSLRYQSAEEMLADLNMAIQRPTERLVVDGPVNYGNTIKMDPVNPEIDLPKPEPEVEPTHRRPVHNDNKKSHSDDKPAKGKKPMEKSTKIAVILAAVSSALIILLGIILLFNMPGCFGGAKEVVIPALVGMTSDEVIEKYSKENGGDFEIKIVDEETDEVKEGTVISQTPESGKKVKANRVITINVAVPTGSFTMPDLVGKDEADVDKELKDYKKYGINIVIKDAPADEKNIGKVIKTEPRAGTTVTKKAEITVYIGVEGVKMEDLSGIKLKDAKEWLKNNKLTLGKTEPENATDNYVVSGVFVEDKDSTNGKKAVFANDVVAKGEAIYLTLTEGEAAPEVSGKTKEITIRIPADKEEVQVRVVQDGAQIHNKKHNRSEGTLSISVAKPATSDTSEIKIYFDGELSMTLDETWR